MSLGKSIRLALVYKNRTATEVAKNINKSESYLSLIMNDKRNPSIEVVTMIAGELGYKTSELIALGE
jgi:transcriptional regulator with XRE-family HTH domain